MTLKIALCAKVRRLLALAALAALAACSEPPAPPVTLRIGVYATISLLPYYVMREQGLDRQHGLKIEETTYPGAEGAIEAMLAGTLDLSTGISTVPLLAAAERSLIPGRLVPVATNSFADPEHPVVGVLAAHGIRTWKDLEGRRIASNSANSMSTAAIEIRLRQEGVRNFSFVQMPFSNLGPAVASGNASAASMTEPYLTQALMRGDGRLLGWVVGGPPFEQTAFTSIVFNAEFLRRQPAGVKAFLRAHLAAVRWINTHPDEARLILAKQLDLGAEVARKVNFLRWPADARADTALLEQTQRLLLQSGRIRRPVDTRLVYDETLLAEVLREAQ